MRLLCLLQDGLRLYSLLYKALIALGVFRRKPMEHTIGCRKAVDDLPLNLLALAVKPSHAIAAADWAALRPTLDGNLRKS